MRISDWSSDVCSSDLSYQAGTDVLKLAYEELGEIDFICCDNILLDPTAATDVRGHAVALETPAEIIAKKVFYRGWSLQPRDMFDLAAVAEHFGSDYVLSALKQCPPDKCKTALEVIDKTNRTEEQKSELQSRMRTSQADFC